MGALIIMKDGEFMNYSAKEAIRFIQEEDIKFIRLAFCDALGRQKNISIMPSEINRAFDSGIAIDASAAFGKACGAHSDMFLHPDPSTIAFLPWRPENGRVVRMFCSITYPDGTPFEHDTRRILQAAVDAAKEQGVSFNFGSEIEFYLFRTDENGNPTEQPHDNAGYMDIAPDDKGENMRREICLTLENMGILPESSHHEEGPGQNEIDFHYSDALSAADNAVTFVSVVKAIAARNGLYADFSPKPLMNLPGSGYHINISAKSVDGADLTPFIIAGIMKRIRDITVFLNRTEESYLRLGHKKAPKYLSWSHENRSQLIRIPAAYDDHKRIELRSADPLCNPYLAFALLIYAGLDGVACKLTPPEETDIDFYQITPDEAKKFASLPMTLNEAKHLASESEFVNGILPKSLIDIYCI